MTNLGKRLRTRRKELKYTQGDIAKSVGVSVATVSLWEKDENSPKGNNLMKLSVFLDCRPDWLLIGAKYPTLGLTDNLSNGPPVKQMIPVISWVQAGEFCESDVLEPYEVEEWMPCPQNCSIRTYGLRVKGDSMTSPHIGERTYPAEIIIFVDPDREVLPGVRVIAKSPDSNEATFKTYVEDDGVKYLKPINPQYKMKEITPGMVICGVVIGSYWPE